MYQHKPDNQKPMASSVGLEPTQNKPSLPDPALLSMSYMQHFQRMPMRTAAHTSAHIQHGLPAPPRLQPIPPSHLPNFINKK